MTRIARVTAIDYPHHIVHRGNNRLRIFFDWLDYEEYLSLLKKYAEKWKLSILAYCLMPNHVHLLIKPRSENALAKMMQGIAQFYAKYINRKYQRTGRLWECRYFSSLVDSERYLWTVVRYIEQNPLRANMAERESDYPYSSAHAHFLGSIDPLLGEAFFTENQRQDYLDFAAQSAAPEEISKLRASTKSGRPFGGEIFIQKVEETLYRNLKAPLRGRPINKEKK